MIYEIVAVIIFIIAYTGIATEHNTHINKSAWALAAGGLLWVVAAFSVSDYHDMEHHIIDTGSEIFSITLFLLAAMSLVEILISCGVFDALRAKMLQYKLSNKKQFLILSVLAFILSGIVDNLTATIILIQIARKFFVKENLLVASVGIVLAANAGGAFSPIGDVTTIMLWIAGKFEASEIILKGFIPSLTIFLVAFFMLRRKIDDSDSDTDDDTTDVVEVKFNKGKKLIIGTALVSFLMPVAFKMIHLPPVFGILFGLGVTWLLVEFLHHRNEDSRLSDNMESLVQKTDISSIKFFVGILMAVAALKVVGVLDKISVFLYGDGLDETRIIIGNTLIGMVSSILDNIPLTAIVIDVLDTTNVDLWVLLAISVGTGGSLLAIGSAAGVIAMGMVKELSFKKYFVIGFVPALVSFLCGIMVWYIQTNVF